MVRLLHGGAPAVGWGMKAVGIQHLQQQVVEGHHVLTLHVVQMLHAFVTVGGKIQAGPRQTIAHPELLKLLGGRSKTPQTLACLSFFLVKEPFWDPLCR